MTFWQVWLRVTGIIFAFLAAMAALGSIGVLMFLYLPVWLSGGIWVALWFLLLSLGVANQLHEDKIW